MVFMVKGRFDFEPVSLYVYGLSANLLRVIDEKMQRQQKIKGEAARIRVASTGFAWVEGDTDAAFLLNHHAKFVSPHRNTCAWQWRVLAYLCCVCFLTV